jgi:glyceraldehyde-3-phosphate dehydrogenase (NADP+)
MRKTELLVAGESVAGQTREILSPHNGEPVSEVQFAGPREIESAMAAAGRAAVTMRQLPIHERAAILSRMAGAIDAQHEQLAAAIRDEAAKPQKLAAGEAKRCAKTFENAAEECKRMADGEGVGLDSVPAGEGRYGIIRRFPLGPVLGISPFNFPLNLSAHKVAPAIAAGCPVVLKPASQTPSAAVMMGRIAVEAGLPPEAISVLPCDRKTADAMVDDDRFRLITFTGSPEVGWALKRRADKKRVVLELGGNAAALVGEDADLDWAVPRLAAGAFAYAGQVCISVQRIFVAAAVYRTFVERLVERTRERVNVAPPTDPDCILSAMIDTSNAERIVDWIRAAEQGGARLLCGGERQGNIVTPAVLTGVAPSADVACREAFGPIVTVDPFDSWDEAIHRVNDSAYGLQAGVFTNDLAAVWRCFNEIEVGAVIHNDYPTFRVDMMPYGGVKDSGFGREGLRWSIADMTEERMLALWPR